MKSWSNSGGYGSNCFDLAGNGSGCVSRSDLGQIGHGPEDHGWPVSEVPKFRQQQPIVFDIPLLKNSETYHSLNSSNSNSNININGLGRFEFAFLFFIFFYDWEIWVCSGIYLCMFNFVLDKKSEMRKVKREKNEKWKKNELKNRARRKKSGEKKIWPSDRNGAHK